LSRDDIGRRIVLLEQSSELGGKITRAPLGDTMVEVGPDAVLTSNSSAMSFIDELGLTDALQRPVATRSGIWNGREVRPMPRGLIAGVPVSPWEVVRARLLSARGAARAAMDLVKAPSPRDETTTVRELVGDRLGNEVVDRLIDPLLGGVFAGNTAYLSAKWSTPQIFDALEDRRSLILAMRAKPSRPGSALASFDGGLSRIVDATSARLEERIDVRTGVAVTGVSPHGDQWLVTTPDETYVAPCVIVAVSTFAAGRLLGTYAPRLVDVLGRVEYASVITVTFTLRDRGRDVLLVPGCVVPRSNTEVLTAITCTSDRWGRGASGVTTIRASLGRHLDSRAMNLSDAEIVQHAVNGARRILGIDGELLDFVIQRWPDALPQYGPEHGSLLDEVTSARADGLELIGAAYEGIGIASCIQQGRAAATRVALRLAVNDASSASIEHA